MSLVMAIEEKVQSFYSNKDVMHNFDHVKRVKLRCQQLCKELGVPYKDISRAVYLHGLDQGQLDEMANFFRAFGLEHDEIEKLMRLNEKSKTQAVPYSSEEKIIHDAHVLEGGKYFAIIKSIVTGVQNSQSISYSIDHFEKRVLPKLKCYFPHTRSLLEEKVKINQEMIEDLRKYLTI